MPALSDLRITDPPICETCGSLMDARAAVLRGLLELQLGEEFLAKPLVGIAEAAKALGWPQSTLYDAVRDKGFPHIRIGARYMLAPANLARLLMGEGERT